MNDPQPIERHLHILKDDLAPLKSPNTALVAAATTSGIRLSEEQPFVQTIEMKEGEPRRQTVWCLKDMETNQRLREKIKENKALLMVRRGNRIAFIPEQSSAAEREKILALL